MRYNRLKIGTDDVGSNQWWRRLNLGSTIEPTSSLPIFKRLYHIIYKTLAHFFLYSWENVKNYHYANFQADPWIFLAKLSRFRSANFASVMTDDVGCSGRHQCTQCCQWLPATIFSDAISWMKTFVFWWTFRWSLFLKIQLTVTKHWFR